MQKTNEKKGHNQLIGFQGEQLAVSYLLDRGNTILARNVRTNAGEIDVVARHDSHLVFVEVKTRSNEAYGMPEEAITAEKIQHMEAAALAWLEDHPEEQGDWRIDVIAIRFLDAADPPEIIHLEGVID